MTDWVKIKPELEVDGSLRDIYVHNADLKLWDKFIEEIARSSFKIEFYHGDEPSKFPLSFKSIRELQEFDPTRLHIWLGESILIICHFFVESELEFDVSPCDLQTEHKYEILLEFLSWLSDTCSRKVTLTHEDSPDMVIVSIE